MQLGRQPLATLDPRELGERLATDAWASVDRLLLCLCLRAWRLQRGRVAVKSPTPPVQARWPSSTWEAPQAGLERHEKELLRRYVAAWKDEADSSMLLKLEQIRLRGAAPRPTGLDEGARVHVDLTEWEPLSPSPEKGRKVTEQRLAEAEQALAESLWLSQEGQRMCRLEVRAERQRRTRELLLLRLAWQAWEEETKPAPSPEVRQQIQPVEQVEYVHSWEALAFKAKASPKKVGEVVRGHDLQGWIRERSDLHMQIQSLKDQLDRERFVFHSSLNSAKLAAEGLQEELNVEKEKLRTKAVLQRAYLQSEITSQDTERMKAERALELVRRRALGRRMKPRLLRRAFRAWARAFRETQEAIAMLAQMPTPASPRRLRFLIEDAERGSFSTQLDHWLEDLDDRSEQELIVDSRDLLKDQAKEAMNSMGKIMEQANAMWEAVRLRIQLFRGFSLSRCQALESQGLCSLIFHWWSRRPQSIRAQRLTVQRCTVRSRPFELAEYFYLWHGLQLQALEMEKLLARSMRGSLVLSGATSGLKGGDLVRLAWGAWQLQAEAARRAWKLAARVPTQDSSLLSDVLLLWWIALHAASEASEERRSSIQVTVEMAPESPANAPHPAPERPQVPRIPIGGDAEPASEELRLIQEAVEKAGSLLEVQQSGKMYLLGDKRVQVQIRGEQVLVKQGTGAAFVPIAKFLAGSATPRARPAAGPASPPGGRTPRSAREAEPKASPLGTPRSRAPLSPKAAVPKSPARAAPKTPSKAPSPKAVVKAPSAKSPPKPGAPALSAFAVMAKASPKASYGQAQRR